MTEDRALVDAVLADAPGAFERLVARHQKLVWHVAWRLLDQPEDVDDVAQEVFVLVHRRLHQFRHESSLASWIGRIARNVAVRHGQRRQLPMAEPGPGEDGDALLAAVADSACVEGRLDEAQRAALLHRAIDALPRVPRTILGLYHLEEMPVADIAAMFDMPEGTVKNHLFRARQHLRGLLDTLEEGQA